MSVVPPPSSYGVEKLFWTFQEVCAEADRIAQARLERRQWGRWRLDTDVLALVLEESGGFLYDVDLERCCRSAEILDWLAQVSKKVWCTPEDVGHLVLALDDIFCLQGRLCGGGHDRCIDASEYLKDRYWADPASGQEGAP